MTITAISPTTTMTRLLNLILSPFGYRVFRYDSDAYWQQINLEEYAEREANLLKTINRLRANLYYYRKMARAEKESR
jgi:hypothetical protein